MRVRWRDFELPTAVVCDATTRTESYGQFIVEPFERGFGVTVGNSLRRILLSSLEGAAVTSVKIEGVQHEFDTISGVFEDVADICLNVKGLLLKIHEGNEVDLHLRRDKKGDVKAGDFECPANAEIMNPDQHICTLTEAVAFDLHIHAEKGRGYATAEENSNGDRDVGTIHLDSSFSPVRRVRYHTENTRVGQLTNYDRLVVEVWTNGTLSPDAALVEAAKILRKHLNAFVQYSSEGFLLQSREEFVEIEAETAPTQDDEQLKELREKLSQPISSLELSVRSTNCLVGENLQTIGELVERSEDEMLKVRNFGRNSLDEVKQKLEERGLELGMQIPQELRVSSEAPSS